MRYSRLWNIVYVVYPPILRMLEKLHFHKGRQHFLIGKIDTSACTEIEIHLEKCGFQKAILAWKDTDETLSMRKIDNDIFQYHIRIFSDGEVRCHYEYTSEGNPWGHIREHLFKPEKEYFQKIVSKWLT